MYKKITRASAAILAAAMLFSAVADSNMVVAQAADTNSTVSSEASDTATAGVSNMLALALAEVNDSSDDALADTDTDTEEAVATSNTSNYDKIGVADVENFVYVRESADADANIVGYLYKDNEATVLDEENGWYYIKSGKLKGYVSSDYLVVGDEERILSVAKRIAIVNTETLRVRVSPDEDSDVITLVASEDRYKVTDEDTEGWVGIKTSDGEGYVSSDYVIIKNSYSHGETVEQQKEREERKAAKEAAAAAAKASGSSSSGSSSSSSKTYSAPSSSTGSSVVAYASQFVGNPYVWGGTSLTNGCDCSGFVMSVYAAFGVSLPHSSASLRSVGTAVDTSAMAAGDIVCYDGHVGIYTGNGTIVNALNSRSGITYTNVNYDHIITVRRIFN